MSIIPLVSIIIPTRNSEIFLEDCLKSIKQQTYSKIEIIVVDNNSIDQTLKIARKYTKLVFNKGPERSMQRNFGAKRSRGKYLLFVDSDMELSGKVVKECVDLSETCSVHKIFQGIVIPEMSFGEGFWAQCKALERSFYLGIGWIESARFFSKKIFKEFGGYDEKQTGTEDYDLPQKIKLKYGARSIGRVESFIRHNEGKLLLYKILFKKYYYAKTSIIYADIVSNKKYFKRQANILERYWLYLSNPIKLFKNPALGFGMLLMKTSEFIAGGFGYLVSRFG